jgi:hypothetical protein
MDALDEVTEVFLLLFDAKLPIDEDSVVLLVMREVLLPCSSKDPCLTNFWSFLCTPVSGAMSGNDPLVDDFAFSDPR